LAHGIKDRRQTTQPRGLMVSLRNWERGIMRWELGSDKWRVDETGATKEGRHH
jgi:hypothetical protein